jgi:ribosome biogenesis protein ERB1
VALPGHAESYNPPPEYLLTAEEQKEWEELDPEDRPRNFMPQRFSSLRVVPGYEKFVQERFGRCLDLYICPRKVKQRVRVDPESLIPKLPKLEDLKPYPVAESLVFTGHTAIVTSISVDPTGRWLVSGSEDCTVRFWEVATGRCKKVLQTGEPVVSVAWCPHAAIQAVAVAFGHSCWLINPRLGSIRAANGTDKMLKPVAKEEAAAEEAEAEEEEEAEGSGAAGEGGAKPAGKAKAKPKAPSKKTVIAWEAPTEDEYASTGIRFKLPHPKLLSQVTWHHSGKYLATVMENAGGTYFHNVVRQHSQSLMTKKFRDVQQVLFHPTKPCIIIATKTHCFVHNLKTQKQVKKLLPGTKWNASVAIHPQGDNILLGSYDRRLCWFDLDLSTKPYKTLRYHKEAIQTVCFHPTYPLFASSGHEGVAHVFHGMVYDDLMKNPLIVPLKMLKGHKQVNGLGIIDSCWHPRQPWLFTAGADATIRLSTN